MVILREYCLESQPLTSAASSILVASMVQVAKLLDAKARSGMYYLEYTVKKPEETEPRHFLSAVALGFNGR